MMVSTSSLHPRSTEAMSILLHRGAERQHVHVL